MATCPSCFTERSDTGACFCDEPSNVILKSDTAPKSVTLEFTVEHVDQELMDLLTDTPMSEAEVIRITRKLLAEHNLPLVTIWWMNSTNKLGECIYINSVVNGLVPTKIRFSRPMFAHMTRVEQLNTITHEVAHALTPGHHHDALWAKTHRSLGGNGQTRSGARDEVLEATKKWKGTCPNGHNVFRAQKSKKMFDLSCGKCSRAFNPEFLFTWKAQW